MTRFSIISASSSTTCPAGKASRVGDYINEELEMVCNRCIVFQYRSKQATNRAHDAVYYVR